MKLIALNTYGGHFFEPLIEFVKTEARDTDIFCFQEILTTKGIVHTSNGARANLFFELSAALPKFHGRFALAQERYDHTSLVKESIDSGLALFVGRDYPIEAQGDFFIYNASNSFDGKSQATFPYNLQYVRIMVNHHLLTVCNVHGTSQPSHKLDTPGRLAQSKKILDFVEQQHGEKIISGDFNLLPDTKSINMFEEAGFHNLIKDYSIQTTRGSFLKKLHPEYGTSTNGWQEFADYTFVSAGIKPTQFKVPDLAISDHLPMILEFEM